MFLKERREKYEPAYIRSFTLAAHIFRTASERTVTEKTLMFYSFHQTIISHSFELFTACFGILFVRLNTTFSHFFVLYTEISQNVWSWKFGLKSWNPIGPHVYEP